MKSQLVDLPPEDRAELASFLLASLETAVDDGAEAAWGVELSRRVDDIRSGSVMGKPADQVFAELRERFP